LEENRGLGFVWGERSLTIETLLAFGDSRGEEKDKGLRKCSSDLIEEGFLDPDGGTFPPFSDLEKFERRPLRRGGTHGSRVMPHADDWLGIATGVLMSVG